MQDRTSPASLENAIALQKYGVGQPVRRKEDDTLVRGKGKYTDDFSLPGQAYAFIVRSSHAHGIIRSIDTKAAATMPPTAFTSVSRNSNWEAPVAAITFALPRA